MFTGGTHGGHSALNFGHISIFTDGISCLYIVMRAIRATMLGAFRELLGVVYLLSNRNQMSLILAS